MQPQDATEIHLVFRARRPSGLDLVQSIGGSNLASQQQQDVFRVKSMLNGGLYYMQLVGEVLVDKRVKSAEHGDIVMSNGSSGLKPEERTVKWALEFKDTPDGGKQSVSSRNYF